MSYNIIADFLRNAVYIVILIFVGRQIYLHPEGGIGIFMMVLTLSGRLQSLISSLLISMMEFGQNLSYMKDFFELQTLSKEELQCPADELDAVSLVFNQVSFTYPSSAQAAIQNLSVHIKDGETVAIVGENGSGKSTFINLIMGFYVPQQGTITVNGEILEGEEINKIRKSTAAVFQDFCHYEGTIRENIEASEIDYIMDEKSFSQLLRQANIEDLVNKQPKGLDEEIGKFSESMNNLSGGQWQRIALARALYRRNTKLMILDEPTAALDPLAEAELYRNFARMTEGKTTLLISHRLGITHMVDRILVFHKGRLVEDGNHESLMEREGYYAKMYRAQAQWYQQQ